MNKLAAFALRLFACVIALGGCTAALAQRTELGNLVFDGIPAEVSATAGVGANANVNPRAISGADTLHRYLESRSASFVDWLADGSLLISTRFANAQQLHRLRAPMGAREQITWSSEPVRIAVGNPYAADNFVFLKDQGGDENMQIYLHSFKSGTDKLLTDGKSLQGGPVWAHDGRRIAFHSNARDGMSYDIYVKDTSSDAAPQLVLGGGSNAYYVQDWSYDDRQLLVLRYASITQSYLYMADLATGKLTPIEPDANFKGDVAVSAARFSRDGRGVFYLTDHGGEFVELRYTDIYTQETRTLAPQSQWDIENLALSDDGHFLAYTLNENGVSRVVLHDVQQQADVLIPALPRGSVVGSLGFDHASKRLAVDVESAQSPRDVYVYSLDSAAPTLARWTQSEIGPLNAETLVSAEAVEFPTWDTQGNKPRKLSAYVYRPRTPGPHPVLVDIHGGPESQYRPGWDAFTQYLVNELGYVVIAPNVRGSSGYGRSFLKLDDGLLREDAVRDIGSLLVWIGLQNEFDRKQVVVMGGSYGGYMTLASLVNYSDRLAGGIDVVGISNFVTFLSNTSPYRRDLRRAEYGDERNPQMREFLTRISPQTNAVAITKPLLIVQGLNDPRVPASESEQMLQKIRGKGGEVWYLAAKDEGHGFRKKANRDVYLETVAGFLHHLKQAR
jgi:dipeptidyl aminopeptidase/acylaminoacyl peptidase